MEPTVSFYRPASIREASELLVKHPQTRIVCGGSDLVVKWKNGLLKNLDGLVDLGLLSLNKIECRDGSWHIGSGATMTQVATHPAIMERFPALVSAVLQVGALQIRNLATLGGNVANASPAGDSIPALFSLDAEVVLVSASGERRVPISSFFTGPGKHVMNPGEIITAFVLPDRKTRGVFAKLGERRAHAISKVSLAVSAWKKEDGTYTWRVAYGAVAPTVIRASKVEQMLDSTPAAEISTRMPAIMETVAGEARPIDDIRSTRDYRARMVPVLLKRALEKLTA